MRTERNKDKRETIRSRIEEEKKERRILTLTVKVTHLGEPPHGRALALSAPQRSSSTEPRATWSPAAPTRRPARVPAQASYGLSTARVGGRTKKRSLGAGGFGMVADHVARGVAICAHRRGSSQQRPATAPPAAGEGRRRSSRAERKRRTEERRLGRVLAACR